MACTMLTLLMPVPAEGQQNELVVLGEKGRAQLVRDRASYIKETIADTQKVRITFSQVRLISTPSYIAPHWSSFSRDWGAAQCMMT